MPRSLCRKRNITEFRLGKSGSIIVAGEREFSVLSATVFPPPPPTPHPCLFFKLTCNVWESSRDGLMALSGP